MGRIFSCFSRPPLTLGANGKKKTQQAWTKSPTGLSGSAVQSQVAAPPPAPSSPAPRPPEIPPSLAVVKNASRIDVWVAFSQVRSVTTTLRERPYEEIASRAQREGALPSGADVAICNDVPRTLFKGRPPLQKHETDALTRILKALAFWDPELAYCQGMNFVTSFALLSSSDGDTAVDADAAVSDAPSAMESQVFWLIATLMQDYGARGMYLDKTPLLKLYSYCLSRLIQKHLPIAYDLFGGLDTVIGFKWFGTLFTTVLPLETAVRAWDLLFHEGLHVLLTLALGLCQLMEPEFVAAAREGEEPAEVWGRLQRDLPHDATLLLPRDGCESSAPSAGAAAGERLLQTALSFPCSCEDLEVLLTEWRRERPEEAADLSDDFSFMSRSLSAAPRSSGL